MIKGQCNNPPRSKIDFVKITSLNASVEAIIPLFGHYA